ncbi:hypothetical protein [Georgfuchsia toluolica]|nr:hypothetical protein [Georgfuchsia toluolica]
MPLMALAAFATPVHGLKYELITHVERMTEATRELHAIIAAMPGPNLPVDKTPPAPPVHHASPLEETLARLDHVAQLIADITRIIEAMPTAGAIASANGRGSTATVSQPWPAIAVLPVAPHPALPPQPVPVPEPDNPILTTALRTAVLIDGGLVARRVGHPLAQVVHAKASYQETTRRQHRTAAAQGRSA